MRNYVIPYFEGFEVYLRPRQGHGECRRQAPSPVAASFTNIPAQERALWPFVRCDDWCGEWEERVRITEEVKTDERNQ